MKECTYLTCNRPSNSWEKAKKKWARKNGEGAGLGREGERSSYSLPLTLFNVCFPPFPISRHCPLPLEQASSKWARQFFPVPMQVIYRCPFRSIWHFKSSYSRCNYSCFSMCKTPLFSYFPFCCRGKFLAICFWWWCFIVDRNELKYFLERSLQSTFISVIVIHRNVHVYLYIITWENSREKRKCSN